MDLVVIGNGIVALTTAFRIAGLAGPNDRIRIVGPRTRDGSATLAAAAMLNSFAELEVGSLDTDVDRLQFELGRRATQVWPAFGDALVRAVEPAASIARLGYGVGTYVVDQAAEDDVDDEDFEAIVAALVACDEPHTSVSPRDIPSYAPGKQPGASRAVYIANEGWINPRLVLAYLDRALATFPQVELVSASADHLRAAGGAITCIVLDDGRVLEGSDYLLAAGAAVTGMLERSALDLAVQRVFYGVGVSLELRSSELRYEHCVRTPNRGTASSIYAAPYSLGPDAANDHILIGASNLMSRDPDPHGPAGSVELLTRCAAEQLHREFDRAELVRVNVGWRPTSQDTYPLLGRTSLKNLVIATGTRRNGFHLSPVISEYLAAVLRGDAVDRRLDVFAPERVPIRSLTRDRAVAKAVRGQMHRDSVERLHDEVGAHDWGIPPEMLEMYRQGHAKP